MNIRSRLFILLAVFALLAPTWSGQAHPRMPAPAAAMINDIVGPEGSGQFGALVVALPNGNIVITDPGYDQGALQDVGAVYLYNGATHALISVLKGQAAGDEVGSDGVTVLPGGGFVVTSPNWRHGSAAAAGAVT